MAAADSKAAIKQDIALLLAQRHVNGGDYWASQDGRWGVGSPFSTLDCGLMLAELGIGPADPLAKAIADLVFACQTDDGRIRPGPHLSVQPCHTASAARLLCHLGYADDRRLSLTFAHLLKTQAADGGWRCSVLKFGASSDTDASNPGVTLGVLDAMRFDSALLESPKAERAVKSLLAHWTIRRPLGPCRFGIGSRFMSVEYPMFRYNLFTYVYVLSFFPRAQHDHAFKAALEALQSKLVDGQVVIEHQKPGLKELHFCRQDVASALAMRRYKELLGNLGR